MTIIQCRKSCGCVTAAIWIDPLDPNRAAKFGREYAADGYTVETVDKVCDTMRKTCRCNMRTREVVSPGELDRILDELAMA
jgi:hypothetical protein